MKLTHVLSIDQFDKPLIEELFYHANWISKAKGHSISHLRGKLLANLFYEASTRTSSSFFAAMSRLGGRVLPINDVTFSSVSKGEILEDTIRTLACYTDIIVLRHPEKGAAERAAAVSPVPIVNAGGGIDGRTVTMMGDLKHGRTVHSLARLLRLYDVKINFVSPAELRMPADLVHPADRQVETLDEVLTGTDVLYVTRVQKERFEATGDYDYG
jgi:aspartate carbamoyltransferase catalytic subunit